ncbi:MAG TPA: (d)CMP kinase [Candidatus Omnitrophota bacterium]|nr:(d)CMP kinase [Candidatus Omnitrophota bacterium]HPT38926.1 (d)CMP kinase [Candidatus Omnitrophota bacterium]
MIIAVDGPAGAGKSTVAKILAKRLGYLYIDTGAMYRALTLKALDNHVSMDDEPAIIRLANGIKIDLKNNPEGPLTVILDGRDVSLAIRQPRITQFVSEVAKIKEVRQILVKIQREFGQKGNCVLDGRDIGTVVFPQAEKKFFIDASAQVRVSRRFKELKGLGQEVAENDVANDLANRDRIDSTRQASPLRQAPDAIYIDTSDLSIEQVVEKMLNFCKLDG